MPTQEVLLFAAAAELASADAVTVELRSPATAATVLAALTAQVPELASLLPACRLAVDQAFVPADFSIPPDAELALIPPVSGG